MPGFTGDGTLAHLAACASRDEISPGPHYGTWNKPKVFFCYNFKLLTNFHQIWQVVAATNAEQCVLKLSIHLACVHTHYLVMLQETELC